MRLSGTDEAASTQSIGLMIACLVTISAFMAAIYVASPGAATDPARSQLQGQATSGINMLVTSSGETSTGVADWKLDPDHMTRFGLALPGAPQNFLDYQKLLLLRNGTMKANATNGYPDYPEVRSALGILAGDIHLRTYPVIPSVDDPRWTRDPDGRIAYVGHYTGEAAACSLNLTTGYTKSATALNVTATIRNDGESACLAAVSFTLRREDTEKMTVTEANTLILQPGQSQTVWTYYNKIHQWWTDYTRVDVDATDAFGNPAVDAQSHRVGPVTVRQVPPNDESQPETVYWISAADRYVVQGAPVRFALYAQDGQSQRGAQNLNNARFVLVGPDGLEWQNRTFSFNQSTDYIVVCANCTTAGNYRGYVWDPAMKFRKQDQVAVTTQKLFVGKNVPTSYATSEIAILARLAAGFSPTVYDAGANPGGDVFVDDVNGNSDLTSLLPRYTTVVVGSEISQNSLLPAAFRNAIRDWVQAGGNLVVLGTNTQQSQWLADVYSAAQANANGGISAPDYTHPLLVSPNMLSFARYVDNGRAWSIDTSQPFTHVLTRGLQGTASQDTLAINAPGALGNGTVTLTSYMPANLTAPQDANEAARFVQNLLAQRYSMLFTDFGPPIPSGVPVATEARLVAVAHPQIPNAVVPVRLVMYSFG